MEPKDIIINGVSINELKKQREAIRQGASELIAENIEKAQSLTQRLLENTNQEEINNLALEAYEALDTAQILSGVSGITFYLPFSENYETNDETFSYQLENSENELISEHWDGAVENLFNLFENMENKSYDWHSSAC